MVHLYNLQLTYHNNMGEIDDEPLGFFCHGELWLALRKTSKPARNQMPESEPSEKPWQRKVRIRDLGFTGCPKEVAKLPAKWAPR